MSKASIEMILRILSFRFLVWYITLIDLHVLKNPWIQKFLKRWVYQTTLPATREIGMQVNKQQLELDMEQQTGSKSGK